MKKLFVALAASTGLLLGSQASAADIPCDTARLVVPWKAGGGTHIIFSVFEKAIQELSLIHI